MAGRRRSWGNTDNLEITLSFPEATAVGCVRLVDILNRKSYYEAGAGEMYYQPGDFAFALVLSDDGFQKDLRRIDAPQVSFEETAALAVGHYSMSRLPTFRLEIGGTASGLYDCAGAVTD